MVRSCTEDSSGDRHRLARTGGLWSTRFRATRRSHIPPRGLPRRWAERQNPPMRLPFAPIVSLIAIVAFVVGGCGSDSSSSKSASSEPTATVTATVTVTATPTDPVVTPTPQECPPQDNIKIRIFRGRIDCASRTSLRRGTTSRREAPEHRRLRLRARQRYDASDDLYLHQPRDRCQLHCRGEVARWHAARYQRELIRRRVRSASDRPGPFRFR